MCVVKGPAQGAMAKTKSEKRRRKKALLSSEEDKAQAESKSTFPPLRTLNEETPTLRALEEDTASRHLCFLRRRMFIGQEIFLIKFEKRPFQPFFSNFAVFCLSFRFFAVFFDLTIL